MLEIRLHNTEDKYDYNELIKVFMPPDNYRLTTDAERCEEEADLHDEIDEHTIFIDINEENSCDKNHIKRQIYEKMRDLTGKCPPWGILTGVRPVKLTGELFKKLKSREKARRIADAVRKNGKMTMPQMKEYKGGVHLCRTKKRSES